MSFRCITSPISTVFAWMRGAKLWRWTTSISEVWKSENQNSIFTKDIIIDIHHQPVENHCLSFRGGAVVIGVENILPGISQILQRHLFVESGESNIYFLEYQNQFLGVINILRNWKFIYLVLVMSRYHQNVCNCTQYVISIISIIQKSYCGAPAW